jgi:hypothetical protein
VLTTDFFTQNRSGIKHLNVFDWLFADLVSEFLQMQLKIPYLIKQKSWSFQIGLSSVAPFSTKDATIMR